MMSLPSHVSSCLGGLGRGLVLTAALAATLAVAPGRAAAGPDGETAGKPVARKAVSGAAGKSVRLDRVVAVVNEAIILESELVARLALLATDLDAITDPRERMRREQTLATQMLDQMVSEELMVAAAEEAKIEVDPAEVQSAVDDVKTQNKFDDAALSKALAMQGLTIGAYRADMRRQILRMRVVNVLVRPKVTITDEDVRARYDAMSRRSEAVSSVYLHHVLVAVNDKATEQEVAAAKARAAEVIEKARAGQDFRKLAAEYSDDASTSQSGGEFGWIERGSIPTEWEGIVFSMEKGEVRGPITGPSGLHVFYVSDVKQTKAKSFDDMKEDLRNDLFRRELEKQTAAWVTDLHKKAYVDLRM